MFTRILVPTDGGPRGEVALDIAGRMANVWDAEIEVLALVEPGDEVDVVREEIEEQVKSLHGRTNLVVRAASFDVADEIADEFESSHNTIVVMATSARAHASGVIHSVAEDVLRYISEPVVLVGPQVKIGDDWPSGPIFLCTDGSDFSEKVIPNAAVLAKDLDFEPWVISVADPSKSSSGDASAFESNHPANLARTLGAEIGEVVNFDVLHNNDPARAIVEYATGYGAGLVAMATHGQTGLKRLALGSVAIGVVHESPCPVLVVRPRF